MLEVIIMNDDGTVTTRIVWSLVEALKIMYREHGYSELKIGFHKVLFSEVGSCAFLIHEETARLWR